MQAARLARRLEAWLEENRVEREQAEPMGEEERRALEALGYAE